MVSACGLVDEGVGQGASVGQGIVAAAGDVLAVIPHDGGGAAVQVHGLHAVVAVEDGGALQHAGAQGIDLPALDSCLRDDGNKPGKLRIGIVMTATS